MRAILCIAAGAAAVAVEKRQGRASSPPLPPQKVPVIGILAQPSTRTPFKQYVASSYVKWVEMAGGVAVPMSYVASNTTTLNLLKQLDGVLLPGGSNPPLPDAARVSVEYALAASSRNESFPVWGTCLGFEWLVEVLAPGALQTGFDAENVSMALSLTEKAAASYLLGGSQKLRSDLSTKPLAMNNHYRGIEPSNFAADRRLALFDVLSTNTDRQGRPFVSTIESAQNLYAVQWHPEKNAFENALSKDGTPFEGINHSSEAVAATFALAQSFVGRARASRHQFMARDAWRFENCVVGEKHRPDFVGAYDLPLAWDGVAAPCVNII